MKHIPYYSLLIMTFFFSLSFAMQTEEDKKVLSTEQVKIDLFYIPPSENGELKKIDQKKKVRFLIPDSGIHKKISRKRKRLQKTDCDPLIASLSRLIVFDGKQELDEEFVD